MLRFLLITILLICLLYSGKIGNKTFDNNNTADTYVLKHFEESAEEFSENFSFEAFDPDEILGSGCEFLENSYPASVPNIPSLTANHSTFTSLILPDHSIQKTFCREAERVNPANDNYFLILPLTYYHPPNA